MASFLYVGVTATGKQVKGDISADSKNEVISLLRKKKIRTISVRRKPLELHFTIGSGVKLQDVSRFTRQFSAMTGAGLPMVQCLDILGGQMENKVLAKIVQTVSTDIQGGTTLADALSRHPKIFNQLYCNMVAAGEASGSLDTVLTRLAEYLEKTDVLIRKIKGAMAYPAIVSVAAVIAIIIMLTFVVPTFGKMFTDLGGGSLPLPTQIVMGISNFLVKNALFLVLGVAAIITAFVYYNKTEKGHYNIDRIKLFIPVFGDLQRKSAISRFSKTLSTLLSSGVTILDALAITSKTAGNKVIEKGLIRTLEKISGGTSIADPLKETGIFPPMVIQMIAVGEKTGGLADMLGRISDFYQEEVDGAVEALTSIIEPILIIVMGIAIGGILISMYLPMFDMFSKVN